MMNQRPASRSYLILGPKAFAPLRTGVKNELVERFSTWSRVGGRLGKAPDAARWRRG